MRYPYESDGWHSAICPTTEYFTLHKDSSLSDLNRLLLVNLSFSAVLVGLLVLVDYGYSQFLNSNYIFRPAVVVDHTQFYKIFLVTFLASLTGRLFFGIYISILIFLSISQIITFEYFGSYILPMHFLQLIPDFGLIMSSLLEVIHEIVPILGVGFGFVVISYLALKFVNKHRLTHPFAGILVLALIGGDFFVARIKLNEEPGKVGEIASRQFWPQANQLAVANAYRSFRYLTVGILPQMQGQSGAISSSLPAPTSISQPDVNIILVLGETIRSRSMSLFGHAVPTTPRLEQIEGLFATSVYPAGTMTRTTFAGLFHRLHYPEIGQQFLSQSNCLFRLAKEQEFQTSFIYGYNQWATDTLLPFMCSEHIDIVRDLSHAPDEHSKFDHNIYYELQNMSFDRPQFVVAMPAGAHSPYGEKVPEEYKIFPNDYDNAIYYTDKVISEIIDIIGSKTDRPTYIIYTGDHGEALKDESDKRGHGWFRQDVLRVPFFFLALNTDPTDRLMTEVGKVRAHFDIATLIAGLMGYDLVVEDGTERTIYVNGSDVSGLAGRLELQISDDRVTSVNMIGGYGDAPSIEEVTIDHTPIIID